MSWRSLGADDLRAWALNTGVLATMHLSWGAGFLRGLVAGGHRTVDTSRLSRR
ncbi:MAG: hypothetical protein R2719_06045 [Micropruina sp.]